MEVTEEIFEQYQHVQESGQVNMANKTGVKQVANKMGFHDLVVFIEEGDYYQLLQNYDTYSEKF